MAPKRAKVLVATPVATAGSWGGECCTWAVCSLTPSVKHIRDPPPLNFAALELYVWLFFPS